MHVNLQGLLKTPGNGHCSTGNAPYVLPQQNPKSLQCHPHAVGCIANKQVEGKILAKKINVQTEQVKLSKGGDSYLKWVKKNDQKKKESKEKGALVQLKQ